MLYNVGYITIIFLSMCQIILQLVKVNYGMNTQNPIDHMRFYRKEKPLKAFRVRQENVRNRTMFVSSTKPVLDFYYQHFEMSNYLICYEIIIF